MDQPVSSSRRSVLAVPQFLARSAVACTTLAAFTSTWGGVYFSGLQVADIFLALSLTIIGGMVVFSDLRFAVPGWIFAPALALLLCVTARSFYPIPELFFTDRLQLLVYQTGSIGKAVFWTLALLGIPIALIACSRIESRSPVWVIAAYTGGAAISSLIAVTDLLKLTHVSSSLGYVSISTRQTGLAVHPNALGLTCALSAPFAVFMISKVRQKLIPSAALLLLLAGALLSGSRGAQAIIPITVFISFLCLPNKAAVLSRIFALGIIGLIPALLLVSRRNPQFLTDLLTSDLLRFGGSGAGVTGSNSERTVLASQALNDFASYPLFGLGIKHINDAHSIYLQILSSGGIVLALGMAVYWGGGIYQAWRLLCQQHPLAPFLLISLATWLVLGSVENQLTDRMLYYTIGCVAAIFSGTLRETTGSDDGRRIPDRPLT